MATNIDFKKVFNYSNIDSINFVGNEIINSNKNIYFIISFYILSLITIFLKFYLDKKEILQSRKIKILPLETRKRLFDFLLINVSLRQSFNLLLTALNMLFVKFYSLILLRVIFYLPFKVAYQAGHFFNLKKGNGLVDSFVFVFLGSTVFLFYVFSKVK